MIKRKPLAKYDFEFFGDDLKVVILKKSCLKCKEYKPVSEFKSYPYYNTANNHCENCKKKYNKSYDKEYSRKYLYKTKYGLSREYIEDILKNQMGICANRACGQEVSLEYKAKNKACVDHCHVTGKVRGVLCTSCNTSLGHIENKNKMMGLTEYLQKHDTKLKG